MEISKNRSHCSIQDPKDLQKMIKEELNTVVAEKSRRYNFDFKVSDEEFFADDREPGINQTRLIDLSKVKIVSLFDILKNCDDARKKQYPIRVNQPKSQKITVLSIKLLDYQSENLEILLGYQGLKESLSRVSRNICVFERQDFIYSNSDEMGKIQKAFNGLLEPSIYRLEIECPLNLELSFNMAATLKIENIQKSLIQVLENQSI